MKVFVASKKYQFIIPNNFNYTLSTAENYKGEPGIYEGDYSDIRATRSYDYHTNYIIERQQWQDVRGTKLSLFSFYFNQSNN